MGADSLSAIPTILTNTMRLLVALLLIIAVASYSTAENDQLFQEDVSSLPAPESGFVHELKAPQELHDVVENSPSEQLTEVAAAENASWQWGPARYGRRRRWKPHRRWH